MAQVNNLVTLSGNPMGYEEFLNQIFKSLRKINHKKIECPY